MLKTMMTACVFMCKVKKIDDDFKIFSDTEHFDRFSWL